MIAESESPSPLDRLDEFAPQIAHWIRRHGGIATERDGIEDLVQRALEKILTSAHNFEYRDEKQFCGYLKTVTIHALRDRNDYWMAESRKARPKRISQAEGIKKHVTGPISAFHRQTVRETIDAAVETLRPDDRDLILRMLKGAEATQIATEDGISRDTASKRMSRARSRLRDNIAILVGQDLDDLFEFRKSR